MKKTIKPLVLFLFLFLFLIIPFQPQLKGFLLFNLQQVRAATALTNVTDALTSTKLSATTTHQINFTTYTSIPKDCKIVITFPSGFNIASTTFSSWSDFDGGRTISTSSQTITI